MTDKNTQKSKISGAPKSKDFKCIQEERFIDKDNKLLIGCRSCYQQGKQETLAEFKKMIEEDKNLFERHKERILNKLGEMK